MIRNLHIRGGCFLGLFGNVYLAQISNLGLEAVDIHGTGNFVGGFVGDVEGIITGSLLKPLESNKFELMSDICAMLLILDSETASDMSS